MNNPVLPVDTSTELASRPPRFALIAIGAQEQHGPHLPISTDSLIAGVLGKAVCEQAGGLLVGPIAVSCSHEHAGFAGTVSVSATTLALQVRDMVESLERGGIGLVVLLNCHGGNYVLGNVAQELNVVRPRVLLLPSRSHWEAAAQQAGIESSISADMHGGEIETSLLLHAMPDMVRREHIRDHAATQRPLLTFFGMRHYTESGIIGYPSRATPAKGAALLQALTQQLVAEIEAVLAAPGQCLPS